jgi:flagellar hook-associated protein 3 FlgL
MVDQSVMRMQNATSALAVLEDQISSGVRVSKPSVDPVAYVQIQSGQADSDRLQTYQLNINSTTATLNSGVSSLQNVDTLLSTAQQLASSAVNGSTDDAAYSALAGQVNGLIQQLFTLVNAKANGNYLFGGVNTTQAPFVVTSTDAAGNPETVSYQGSDQAARAIVGPGQTVNTAYAGNQVFQQPGADIFQALIGLRDALSNPALSLTAKSQAASTQMAQIQQAQSVVENIVGQQSTSLQSLQTMGNQFNTLQLTDKGQTSDLKNTDISQAIVSLQEQQNLLQATLAITSQLFSPSFLSFLNSAGIA